MFKRIGIIAKPDDPAVRDTLQALLPLLDRHGIDVVIDTHCADMGSAGADRGAADKDVGDDRDLIIAIGGDGTLLRAAQLIFPRKIPLMGINLGRLGFLTDLSPPQLATGMDAILNGAFVSEERFVLNCTVVRSGDIIAEDQGLNDIVIQKWNTARLITFETFVNGEFVHSQRSDGMIVSTPTGSTAYALSGGGPILHPALAAIALVPICPHTLTNRPIVISDSSIIEIRMGTAREGESRVTCDGNSIAELAPGDLVRLSKHPKAIHLIHPANHDHFATLRAKLQWGRDPC